MLEIYDPIGQVIDRIETFSLINVFFDENKMFFKPISDYSQH